MPKPEKDANATQELSVADLLPSIPPPLPKTASKAPPPLDAAAAPPEPEPVRAEAPSAPIVPIVAPDAEPEAPKGSAKDKVVAIATSALAVLRARAAACKRAVMMLALFVAYVTTAFWRWLLASAPVLASRSRSRLGDEWTRAAYRSAGSDAPTLGAPEDSPPSP
jgi:hypothetical protein